MSTTASDSDLFYQHIWVTWAGLPLAAKDISEGKVTSLVASSIDIVFVGAAAFFDAKIHNSFNINK